MSLDAVKNTINFDHNAFGTAVAPSYVFSKWQNFPISKISHHGLKCCEMAREWLNAMDYSQLNAGSVFSGPRWIRQRYNWGPTKWQIHWCEAVNQKSLDCGAQAALAHEVFTMRGVESYQVQLVQQFSKETTAQWAQRWTAEETSIFWIDENMIYHECCAVVIDNGEIKLWDGSSSSWINSKQFNGYGTLRALRLFAAPNEMTKFKWGEHIITANKWQEIKGL
jgi:hypothetical protein